MTVDLQPGPRVGRFLNGSYDDDDAVQAPAAGNSWAAIDATRLEPFAFVVPPSGTVLAVMRALGSATFGTSTTSLQWGFLQSGVAVPRSQVLIVQALAGTNSAHREALRRITGLTPGETVTWTPAHRRSSGAGACATVWGDSDGTGDTSWGDAFFGVFEDASLVPLA